MAKAKMWRLTDDDAAWVEESAAEAGMSETKFVGLLIGQCRALGVRVMPGTAATLSGMPTAGGAMNSGAG